MGQLNASLPGELMAEVRKLAQAEERTTDELVQGAVKRLLRLKHRQKLYDYGEQQARKLLSAAISTSCRGFPRKLKADTQILESAVTEGTTGHGRDSGGFLLPDAVHRTL